MIHKLKSQRGETLVENMASILIAALSVALLFTCIMASVQIDSMAQRTDMAYYSALTAAETQTADADLGAQGGIVKIEEKEGPVKEFTILLYGGEGMYAYTRDRSAGEEIGP